MVLESFIKPKRFFDENSKKDIEVVKNFLKNDSWGIDCCPFILEPPYQSIPEMIKDRVIMKALNIQRKYDESCN
jgi:hypothetical protein